MDPREATSSQENRPSEAAAEAAPVAPQTQALGGLSWKPHNVKLRSLTLDNFKSFQRKTTIPFGEGFTAVSGPNGSGKSNLIDAILFVLGFANSKGLRADRLTDLICSDGGKPSARVTLEFEALDEENKTRTFEVGRVVRRTRAGQEAHYEVDGSPIKLADLHDLLRDLGLPSSGWNVILQGDVTRLTLMGPVARRQILDEQAGAKEFDKRITAANEELAQADKHVDETRIIREEIEKRLVSLAKEREQALELQRLREKRAALEAELLLLDVVDAESQAQRKADEVEARNEQVEGRREELAEAIVERDRVKAELEALEAEIQAKGEGERLERLKQAESLKAAAKAAREKAAAARAERDQVLAGAPERTEALETAEEQHGALEAKAKTIEADLDGRADEHARLEKEFGDALAASLERDRKRIDVAQAQRAVESELEVQRAHERDVSQSAQALAGRGAAQRAERAEVERAMAQSLASKAELERSEAEAASARRMAMDDLAHEQERLRKLVQQNQNLTAGLDSLERDLHKAETEVARVETMRRMALEGSGHRGLEAVREAGVDGIHGFVRDLVKFEPRFAAAIDAAAGGRLSWVVVEDEHVAKRAIDALKQARAGRLTFAPLTKLARARVQRRNDLTRTRGILGYALDLVEFESRYEVVVENVLTDTLVVETLDVALPLLGKHRIVTLDGDLLETRGLITGGEAGRGAGALAAMARADQELATKEKTAEELRRRRDAARSELHHVAVEAEKARAALSERQTRVASAEASFRALHEQVERLLQTLAGHEERLKKLDAALASVTGEEGALEARRADVAARIAALEAKKAALASPDAEDAALAVAQEREAEVRALGDALARLRNDLAQAQVELRGAEDRVAAARKAIADASERTAALDEQAVHADQDGERLEAEHRAREAEVQALVAELAELTEKRDELRQAANEARDVARDLGLRLEKDIEEAAKAAEESARLATEAQGKRAAAEARNIQAPRICPEVPLGKVQLGDELVVASEARKKTARDVEKTDGAIEALGPVNMLAISQYDEHAARKAELDEKLATLDREKEALRARIVELDGAKRRAFLEAFEAVATAFSEAFGELARGEGRLRLENPDSPFEGGLIIEARPRGKKILLDSAMSGGEKSLTSLAFLFALQSVNPAPFYVLDEVDMNLDGANTDLLAEAIKRRAQQHQYLVVSHHRSLLERAARALGATMRKGFGTQIVGIDMSKPEEATAVAAGGAGGA